MHVLYSDIGNYTLYNQKMTVTLPEAFPPVTLTIVDPSILPITDSRINSVVVDVSFADPTVELQTEFEVQICFPG
jgi:hypothetical protein